MRTVEALSPDVRGALRALRRSPGFALLAAVTLGLGAGAAGAMFTMLRQVVLEPLPVTQESAVVVAWGRHRTRAFDHFPWSYEAWVRIAEGARGITGMAATEVVGARERLVEDGDRLTPMRWSRVLGDFFGVLGVNPALGRTLGPGDDVRGGPRVAVVSYGLWLRRWGGRRTVLGSSLTVAGRPHTVVGVLPRDFDFPRGTEVWTPARAQLAGASAAAPGLELDLVARLAPGATPELFGAELGRLVAADPALAAVYGEVEPVVRTLRDVVLGDVRPVVTLLFAGALLLLLVAGVNVASLVLVRAGDRAGSWAVRRALGARAAHLAAAPIVEATAVTALAGLVAAVATRGCLRAVLPLAPSGMPRLEAVRPDAATWLALVTCLALWCAVLAVLPLLRRPDSTHTRGMLRSGGHVEGRHQRPRALIVAGQAALALWAVVTAALLVRSLANLRALDAGFQEEGLHVVQIDHRHAMFAVPPDWPDRARAALDRLAAEPGVLSATPVVAPPLIGNGGLDVVPALEGGVGWPEGSLPYMNLELTMPGYFETLRLPVVRGRPTTASDAAGAPPVVVVNEKAARALWPGDDALGKRLRLPFPGYEDVVRTVVGVAADARYRALLEVRPSLYVPLRQMPIVAPRWIAVRTSGALDPAGAVATAFADADPGVRVVAATSVADRMAAPLARPRLALAVLGTVAAIVLLLAGVGAYGATAAGVSSRAREMGVRMACGATPIDVGALVLREGLTLAAAGAAAGGIASLATERFVESLLFGVRANDPMVLAAAAAIVLASTIGACLSPALRAARTDPMTVLRSDD